MVHGECPHDQKVDLLARATALLFPIQWAEPFGLVMTEAMACGTPVIAWRKATAKSLYRSFAAPMGSGLVAGAIAFVLGVRNFYAVLAISVAVFALATVWIEFWRGMRVRQAMMGEKPWTALSRLIGKNHRRYGGYIVHVGVVMIFIGIVASSVFKLELQRSMKVGDSATLGGYTVRYDGIEVANDAHVERTFARVSVWDGDKRLGSQMIGAMGDKAPAEMPQRLAEAVAAGEIGPLIVFAHAFGPARHQLRSGFRIGELGARGQSLHDLCWPDEQRHRRRLGQHVGKLPERLFQTYAKRSGIHHVEPSEERVDHLSRAVCLRPACPGRQHVLGCDR